MPKMPLYSNLRVITATFKFSHTSNNSKSQSSRSYPINMVSYCKIVMTGYYGKIYQIFLHCPLFWPHQLSSSVNHISSVFLSLSVDYNLTPGPQYVCTVPFVGQPNSQRWTPQLPPTGAIKNSTESPLILKFGVVVINLILDLSMKLRTVKASYSVKNGSYMMPALSLFLIVTCLSVRNGLRVNIPFPKLFSKARY